MADIQVHHHPEDSALASDIVKALNAWGLSATAGTGGGATLVVWTLRSARDEGFSGAATLTSKARRISARFTPCVLPPEFAEEEVVNVIGWAPPADHDGWTDLVERLASLAYKARSSAAAPVATVRPAQPTVAPAGGTSNAPGVEQPEAAPPSNTLASTLPLALTSLCWAIFAFVLIWAFTTA